MPAADSSAAPTLGAPRHQDTERPWNERLAFGCRPAQSRRQRVLGLQRDRRHRQRSNSRFCARGVSRKPCDRLRHSSVAPRCQQRRLLPKCQSRLPARPSRSRNCNQNLSWNGHQPDGIRRSPNTTTPDYPWRPTRHPFRASAAYRQCRHHRGVCYVGNCGR